MVVICSMFLGDCLLFYLIVIEIFVYKYYAKLMLLLL